SGRRDLSRLSRSHHGLPRIAVIRDHRRDCRCGDGREAVSQQVACLTLPIFVLKRLSMLFTL
ncbi:MAG: hypothetical protein VX259_01460, partial [Pseudomonadota bacterium]|nr:hypothetical protein [Pseudomonadota bacterium]